MVAFTLTLRGRKTSRESCKEDPLHYWVTEAFSEIGESLGRLVDVDVKGGRISVTIDVSKPLKFERKVQFDNGDEVLVKLQYEKLYRFCYTCHLISHEERNCPKLTEREILTNKMGRMDLARQEISKSRATGDPEDYPWSTNHREIRRGQPYTQKGLNQKAREGSWRGGPSRDQHPLSRPVRRNLHLMEDYDKHTTRNSVWQRLDENHVPHLPRLRETSFQASSGSRKRGLDESHATSSWNPKRNRDRNPNRREDSYKRSRSPRAPRSSREQNLQHTSPRREPSFAQWQIVNPQKNYLGRKTVAPRNNYEAPNRKKGETGTIEEMEMEIDREEEGVNIDMLDTEPTLGPGKAQPQPQKETAENNIPCIREENTQFLTDVVGETLTNADAYLSDWEAIAEDGNFEITAADERRVEEIEKELLEAGFLHEEDDLLGEELNDEISMQVSTERTVSDPLFPRSIPTKVLPASSQSPTSKATPAIGGQVNTGRAENLNTIRTPRENAIRETRGEVRKRVPKSPTAKSGAASRKLKAFSGKTSPKKSQGGNHGAHRTRGGGISKNVPRDEENLPSRRTSSKSTTRSISHKAGLVGFQNPPNPHT